MFKKVGWISAVVLVGAGVASLATAAVSNTDSFQSRQIAPPLTLSPATRTLPAAGGAATDVDKLRAQIEQKASDPRLGKLSGIVTDAQGNVVWERGTEVPAKPASTTKILTAAAALLTLDLNDRIETQVVRADAGTVVIRAAGDVMMTDEQLDELAQQIGAADTVLIDTSLWSSETFVNGWGRENIAAGYIAPMEPAMLYGGRIGGHSGDLTRSTTPAEDVAKALASRLGATSGKGQAPANAEVVASVQSDPLWQRLETMMENSDNVMAEAVGREVALKRGTGNSVAAAVQATQDALKEAGFDLTGLELKDNSGLTETNYNTPRLLQDLLHRAVTDAKLRPLLDTLPIAAANGTLENRYHDTAGQGWVRAKTGTLTGVSALAGIVTARDGNSYTFALLSNESDILAARAALDELVSGLR
ncbi:D-alanyl-D-alanine carboxypeptidase DacC precursor [Corynebacterium kalinowskii]|uniref:D-alanyl-D-alanine carboxypeptidase DacC n=1 Tax=Corynebacterium kalinowskii TaxID=2675216 RepID=A0A6B8VNA1_9CORY|nr:D-alanyl-D-alanine carboxypeptidase/D-alanyl-D-alanine-endopeptidase [Corynebacterium kalinowskii]QGU01251.1 D-alanyl-D-alanine carboxypeptidase DacC precursor [Corynebacterium kalinowskii]